MKIAFDALNIKQGGGLTVLTRLARAFSETGHETHVVSSASAVLKNMKNDTRIEVHEVKGANNAFAAQLFRHRGWNDMMRTIRANVVFSFNYWVPTSLPQATYHINVIPFMDFDQRRRAVGIPRAILQARYSQLALRHSELNLFESEHIFSLARATSVEISHPIVSYIGIEIPEEGPSLELPRRHIVAVTSSARHKHNEHLFALHRALRPLGIGLRLIGITADALDATAEMRAERNYALAQPDIAFVGYCNRDRLYDELRKALALVSFSELESFFMVPAEAMAVGCPAVVTDQSSVRESVGNAGLLIAPGAVDQAAAHVTALLNPATRAEVVKRGRAWIDRFDTKKCTRAIVSAVEKLL